jgi:hypothetical protein
MSEPLRIRLARTKTIPEIEEMIADLKNDPDSRGPEGRLAIYTDKVMKRLDEMTWAIYSIRKRENNR